MEKWCLAGRLRSAAAPLPLAPKKVHYDLPAGCRMLM
jgi:hypothetical protein